MESVDPLEALEAEEAADYEAAEETAPEPAAEPEAQPEPELIGGKFKSVDDLLRSYQEVERYAGGMADELGTVRRRLDEMETRQAQPAADPGEQQYLADGTPFYSDDQLQEWVDDGTLTSVGAMKYQAHYAAYAQREAVKQEIENEFAPVKGNYVEQAGRQALAQLDVELAPHGGAAVLDRNRDALMKRIEGDREFYGPGPNQVARLRDTVLALDVMANRTQAPAPTRDPRTGQPVVAQRDVHVEGGSGPQPSGGGQQLDEDIAELLSYRENSDIFGKK